MHQLCSGTQTPVDEHTGIPSVILPIDQLSGRQLSVPIILSYHAAGNKVQDVARNDGYRGALIEKVKTQFKIVFEVIFIVNLFVYLKV